MSRGFASHTHETAGKNHAYVVKIKERVEGKCIIERVEWVELWVDSSEMVGGDGLSDGIDHGIDGCENFIIFLTKEYVEKMKSKEKNWIISEVARGTRGDKRIIVVRMENDVKISRMLSNMIYIDFSDVDFDSKATQDVEKFNQKCNELVQALLKPMINCTCGRSVGKFYDQCCSEFLCLSCKKLKMHPQRLRDRVWSTICKGSHPGRSCEVVTLGKRIQQLQTKDVPKLENDRSSLVKEAKGIHTNLDLSILKSKETEIFYDKVRT
jgi:hypothetical protein